MKINATAVVDNLAHEFNVIEQFHHLRNGRHLYIASLKKDDPLKIAYEEYNTAERNLNLASYVLDVSITALYRAVLAARRWYTRTDWQKCLPEDDAERLLSCMVTQYPSGTRKG